MQQEGKWKLYLGSQSPRRKELLSWLPCSFKIITGPFQESLDQTISGKKLAEELSYLKGEDLLTQHSLPHLSLLITADTVVSLAGKNYGKPEDQKEAEKTLRELEGKTHQVSSGLSLFFHTADGVEHRTVSGQTHVTFGKISEAQLSHYLKHADYLDKAGAYGMQEEAMQFVEKIEGSPSNVIGLPLYDLTQELAAYFGKDDFWSLFDNNHGS